MTQNEENFTFYFAGKFEFQESRVLRKSLKLRDNGKP